eukprot:6194926-Pleurochrysis_carterae.AAC.2
MHSLAFCIRAACVYLQSAPRFALQASDHSSRALPTSRATRPRSGAAYVGAPTPAPELAS